ncbi:MAG: hypothetical protein PHW60_07390 [Kiritimatiellae bacterium]|nr:hypothetical protein [Kiritimatiellia bacterium]
MIFIIGLGWFLAAYFSRISGCTKGLSGIETTQGVSRVKSLPDSGNINQTSAAGVPAGK